MALGVAVVHAEQLGGEEGGLLAAGTGPDLEDDVAVVVGVARQQLEPQVRQQPDLVRLQLTDDLLRQLAGLSVCARLSLVMGGSELLAHLAKEAVVLDDRRQNGLLTTQTLGDLQVGRDAGLDHSASRS